MAALQDQLAAQQAKVEKLKMAGRKMREERDAARQAAGEAVSPVRSQSPSSGWGASEPGSPIPMGAAELEARVAELEASLKDAEVSRAALEGEKSTLEAAAGAGEMQAAALNARIAELEAALTDAASTTAALTEEAASLKAAQEASGDVAAGAEGKVEGLEAQVLELEAALETASAKADQEAEGLMQAHAAELREAQAEAQRLQDEVDSRSVQFAAAWGMLKERSRFFIEREDAVTAPALAELARMAAGKAGDESEGLAAQVAARDELIESLKAGGKALKARLNEAAGALAGAEAAYQEVAEERDALLSQEEAQKALLADRAAQLDALRVDRDAQREAAASMGTASQQHEDELKKVSTQLSNRELEVATLRQSLEELKDEFSHELAKEDKRVRALRKERDEAKAEAERLVKEAERKARERSSEQGSLQELREEAERLAVDLGTERERSKELARERKAVEEGKEAARAAVAKYQASEKDWHEARAQLEQRERHLAAQVEALERQGAEAKRDEGEVRAKLADTEAKLATALSELATKNRALESSSLAKEAELLKEREVMEQELSMLRTEMSQTVIESDARAREMTQDAQAAVARAVAAEEKLAEMVDDIPEVTRPLLQQIAELEEALGPLETKHAAAEAEKAAVASLNKELSNQLTAKDEELLQMSAHHRTVKADLGAQLQALRAEIQDHASEARAQQDVLAKEKATLVGTVEHLEAQSRALEDEKAKLRREVEELLAVQTPTTLLHSVAPTPSAASIRSVSDVSHLGVDVPPSPVAVPPLTSEHHADKLAHVQAELHRYVVENGKLKDSAKMLTQLQAKFKGLHGKHETMLQMYGEKAEECELLKAKMEEAEKSFARQIEFFAEKLK
eukprot:TRINITY_DN2747_c0_g2_i1.p1 TRINITY_DN2747_c0_g2~~TRINITY_DN2747_c0_g2_i1.p1  ORF type:complete len:945 (+),score=410.08 TRINITY_DN2747_c0_g2_i1:239-2836(+)